MKTCSWSIFLYHQTVAPLHCQAKLLNNAGFNPFKIINCISVGSNVKTTAWHSYLILLNMSPVWKILTNWLSVVASWKYAVFSFTKKVSGTQISLIYSAPTTSLSRPGRRSKDNLGSCQNCRKYMSRVKSWKISTFNISYFAVYRVYISEFGNWCLKILREISYACNSQQPVWSTLWHHTQERENTSTYQLLIKRRRLNFGQIKPNTLIET